MLKVWLEIIMKNFKINKKKLSKKFKKKIMFFIGVVYGKPSSNKSIFLRREEFLKSATIFFESLSIVWASGKIKSIFFESFTC